MNLRMRLLILKRETPLLRLGVQATRLSDNLGMGAMGYNNVVFGCKSNHYMSRMLSCERKGH
jgi:hypothetical protein